MKKKKLFVSLTGMSGSGKTTLFNNLKEVFTIDNKYKVGFMYEGARQILTHDMVGFDLSKYLKPWNELSENDKVQYELWQSKLCLNFRENLDACKDAELIISDRSPVDQLVYYLLQCDDKNSPMYNNIMTMLAKVNSEYNHILIYMDTPLDKVQENLKMDIGHHYTDEFYNLLNEKTMFTNVIKEIDSLSKVYIVNGNDDHVNSDVMKIILKNLGDK